MTRMPVRTTSENRFKYKTKRTRHTERVDDGSETVQHDLVLSGLVLEGINDTIDEANLETFVDVGGTERRYNHCNRFHHHLPVEFRLILELVGDPAHDLCDAGLPR